MNANIERDPCDQSGTAVVGQPPRVGAWLAWTAPPRSWVDSPVRVDHCEGGVGMGTGAVDGTSSSPAVDVEQLTVTEIVSPGSNVPPSCTLGDAHVVGSVSIAAPTC